MPDSYTEGEKQEKREERMKRRRREGKEWKGRREKGKRLRLGSFWHVNI